MSAASPETTQADRAGGEPESRKVARAERARLRGARKQERAQRAAARDAKRAARKRAEPAAASHAVTHGEGIEGSAGVRTAAAGQPKAGQQAERSARDTRREARKRRQERAKPAGAEDATALNPTPAEAEAATEAKGDGKKRDPWAKRPVNLKGLLLIVKREPSNFPARTRAAEILALMKRFDEAEALLAEGLVSNPLDTGMRVAQADILAATGRVDEAVAALRDLMTQTSEKLRLRICMAGILMDAGRLDEAAAELEAGAALRTRSHALTTAQARLALLRRQPAEAARLLETIDDPDHRRSASYGFFLGAIYLDELHEAERAFQVYQTTIGEDFVREPIFREFFMATARTRLRIRTWLDRNAMRPQEGRLSRLSVLEDRLRDRIEASLPTSLIRMADGEGRVLSGKDPKLGGAVLSFTQTEPLSPGAMAEFQAMFRDAIHEADILGLPTEDMLRNADNRSIIRAFSPALIARLASGETMACDHGCHWLMHETGAYGRLLRGAEFVGIASGRDFSPYLVEEFGVKATRWYEMPAQARHGGLGERPHYPDRFREVLRELEVPFRGAIFLVAAGQVGKIYCGEIRRRGGIAIDIGAVADAWSGVAGTRPMTARNPNLIVTRGSRPATAPPDPAPA
jgi:tetratricopeptide (TPR) repeat protein